MSWLQRYRLREFIQESLWLTPVLSMAAAIALAPLLYAVDERTHVKVLHYGLEGARAIGGAIAASTFTLTVLVFSIILVAVQLATR